MLHTRKTALYHNSHPVIISLLASPYMYLCDNNESSHIKEEVSGHVHCACSEWLEEQEHVLSMWWACDEHVDCMGTTGKISILQNPII